MDLNLYPVFVCVYESDTLTEAGERLHLSQSAISHALKRLQEGFGEVLFEKQGRKLVATAQARRHYPQIKQALQLLETASQPAGSDTADNTPQLTRINVAMNDEIEMLLLPYLQQQLQALPKAKTKISRRASATTTPSRLNEFDNEILFFGNSTNQQLSKTNLTNHHATAIRLHSVRLQRRQMVQSLRLGEVDVAIDVRRMVSEQIKQMPLFCDSFVVLSNDRHIQQGQLDKACYLAADHITVSSRPTGQSVEDILLAQLDVKRQTHIRCQHYLSAIRVLTLSQTPYLLTLPKQLAQQLAHMTANPHCASANRSEQSVIPPPDSNLTLYACPFALPELSLQLYWHQDSDRDPSHRWIREQLQRASTLLQSR